MSAIFVHFLPCSSTSLKRVSISPGSHLPFFWYLVLKWRCAYL